jgi:hypothetical protein
MHTKFLLLAANAMAAFMDFGVGCLLATLVIRSLDLTIAWPYALIGGLLALIPDLDLVPSVIMGRSARFDHRQTPFHRPLLVLPIVTLLGFLFGGIAWASIAFLCVLWHYLHDTNFVDTSYGIAWLWPFSDQYWSVWGSYMGQSDMGHHQWLAHYWLRPTFLSVREIGIGAVCLFVGGMLSGVPLAYALISIGCIAVGVLYTWVMGSSVVL